MTREAWLEAHAYLQPVAELCAAVDRALAAADVEQAPEPRWADYEPDFRQGVPLLHSESAGLDLEPAGRATCRLAEALAADPSSGRIRTEAAALEAELAREPEAPRRVADWLLGRETLACASPGLLRYLGWRSAARYLVPVVQEFDRRRDEDRWLRHACPTCGSAPAMAQLSGTDPGRVRMLSCGRCGTRWRFPRTACPFCGNDVQRLAVVGIEGEGGLRLDYCEACSGYLKTYDGQGNEDVLLSDWTSLHLDVVARDRGLKRRAASLYELTSLPPP